MAMGPGDILLHVGLPKTGTTSLQQALRTATAELAGLGVLYPGDLESQVPDLFAPLGWSAAGRDRELSDRWDRLQAEVHGHPDRVVVSAENLATADRAAARRVLMGLGRNRTRVVVTVRRLDLLLVSFWQHEVRAGLTEPLAPWAARMAEGPVGPIAGEPFWIAADIGRAIEVWAGCLGAESVTVVVVDPSDHQGILRSFEQLIGLPDGFLPSDNTHANRSLTADEAELIRRLNISLAGRVRSRIFNEVVPDRGVQRLLNAHSPGPDERRLALSGPLRARLVEHAERAIELIAESGVHVLGELDQLRITGPFDAVDTGNTDEPEPPSSTIAIDSAIPLIEHLIIALGRVRRELEQR